jgi:acyl-CoA synthetase (AMP-forming)/AMP-acid ligase II
MPETQSTDMLPHQNKIMNLESTIAESCDLTRCFVQDSFGRITWDQLLSGSSLYSQGEELQGRSVLLTTTGQLTTLSALVELDGIARRIILCPPDLPTEHLPYIIETAEVDSIVSDRSLTRLGNPRTLFFSPCSRNLSPRKKQIAPTCESEWILLTSGTTGLPKLVVHSLASLTAAIRSRGNGDNSIVWSTFYDIRRYGGLQILLRAALTGTSLVLSTVEESTSDLLARTAASVTHISGTPSQWRRALMNPLAHVLNPRYVRLSGEAVDQAILNKLRTVYPDARMVHAFASTEAGVAFEVTDGQAGFPAETLQNTPQVEMKVEESTLRIRSAGNARCYLGSSAPRLKDQAGFVDTSDVVELRDGRYYFAGRRDGVINIGGLKVYPEEVEAVVSRHPDVDLCIARARKNPLTGSLIVVDIVLRAAPSPGDRQKRSVQEEVLQLCRDTLPPHKVPAAVNVVSGLEVASSGKVMRRNA